MAAHAVRLAGDLQRSRERLVTAREEERRRLRRDLHDGLGPTLAGDAAAAAGRGRLVATDRSAADARCSEVKVAARAAVGDIRRLVYELRPPALDELGLVGALQRQADAFSSLDVARRRAGARGRAARSRRSGRLPHRRGGPDQRRAPLASARHCRVARRVRTAASSSR